MPSCAVRWAAWWMRASAPAAAYDPTAKQKAQAKTARIPIKIVPAGEVLKKPDWIRVKAGSPSTRFYEIKEILLQSAIYLSVPSANNAFKHAQKALSEYSG